MRDDHDLIGSIVAGRYRIERKLGEGGMGTVWRVAHVESLQKYALKTLHARTASDRTNVERFLREARAAAALHSRHVVRVVDAQMGYADPKTKAPMPFLVMELLEGSNLEQIIHFRGALTPAQVVWVLQQVARALDLAHAKGIVHRDLKPENLFLARDDEGQPVMKVCDFGIAKLEGESSGLLTHAGMGTAAGASIGTPMYMAPEQARDAASVVPATDQWAVALIAFRALCAREYFAGARSSADLLLKIVNDPLVRPSTRDDRLTPEFDAWFMRSCERDPAARWKSVGEQVAALKTALDVESPTAPEAVPVIEALGTAKTEPATPSDAEASDTIATDHASTNTRPKPATTAAVRGSTGRSAAIVALVVLGAAGTVWALRGTNAPSTATSSTSTAIPSTTTAIPSTLAAIPSTSTAIPSTTSAISSSSSAISSTSGAISSTTAAISPTPSAISPTPSAPRKTSGAAPVIAVAAPKTSSAALPTTITAATSASSAPPPPAAKHPSGAACDRNSDCASGICAAYTCQ